METSTTLAQAVETVHDSNETNIDDLPVVLIAEDNEDMRIFISEFLFSHYKILEAANGKDALELAHENSPDVIISDIMMSEMSGLELCERIKKDERTSHIPVILLTAKASPESTEKGFEAGADYYLTKPFNPKLLELLTNSGPCSPSSISKVFTEKSCRIRQMPFPVPTHMSPPKSSSIERTILLESPSCSVIL